jgi:hypothetical protein
MDDIILEATGLTDLWGVLVASGTLGSQAGVSSMGTARQKPENTSQNLFL